LKPDHSFSYPDLLEHWQSLPILNFPHLLHLLEFKSFTFGIRNLPNMAITPIKIKKRTTIFNIIF
tara:strand:- start:819 stop:1013 length:195 start_codon:yes stop_codon:yes gene_type:complete